MVLHFSLYISIVIMALTLSAPTTFIFSHWLSFYTPFVPQTNRHTYHISLSTHTHSHTHTHTHTPSHTHTLSLSHTQQLLSKSWWHRVVWRIHLWWYCRTNWTIERVTVHFDAKLFHSLFPRPNRFFSWNNLFLFLFKLLFSIPH